MKIRLYNFLFLTLLVSCSQTQVAQPTHFTGWAMTMPYHIAVGKKVNAQEQEQISSIIKSAFDEIDLTVNNWNPYSEVSHLNRALAEARHAPSSHLKQLLSLCALMHQLTEGKFDPTIAPLSHLWKRALSSGVTPNQAELLDTQKTVGWHHIHFGAQGVWKDEAKTSLDLCAISKGYCIDLLTERLTNAGFADLFIEWAGEIRATGDHPSGRAWTVQIEPLKEITILRNGAIATSGDYAQKEWGQGYFHIIDPIQGTPLLKKEGSISAATVIAPTCAMADALATALMLFESKEVAEKWSETIVQQMPEVSIWIFVN